MASSNSQVFSDSDSNEVYDSNTSNSSVIQAPNLQNQDINTTTTNGSGLKGMVLQPNGEGRVQTYVNQQRIHQGTFRLAREAAIAYDNASMKIRRWDMKRNIVWKIINIHESSFQNRLSDETVINMKRDGSYVSKFLEYVKEHLFVDPNIIMSLMNGEIFFENLFQKELTPSDVSGLNRLVIPKRFGEMYFCEIAENNADTIEKEIRCYDILNAQWKFRFKYWKSSHSFAFTSGWNTFLNDKKLKEKDMIVFYNRRCRSDPIDTSPTFVIDFQCYNDEVVEEEENDLTQGESTGSTSSHGVMLFGVRIA